MGYVVQRAIKSSQTDDVMAMDPMSTRGGLLLSTLIGLVCLCGSFYSEAMYVPTFVQRYDIQYSNWRYLPYNVLRGFLLGIASECYVDRQ